MAQNCNNCKKENEEMTMVTMSGANWEKNEERHSREKKRLWITILVLIGALIGTNLAWIVYESSFEEVITTTEEHYDVEQDADGGDNNSIINGGVINGEAESKVHEENNDQNP